MVKTTSSPSNSGKAVSVAAKSKKQAPSPRKKKTTPSANTFDDQDVEHPDSSPDIFVMQKKKKTTLQQIQEAFSEDEEEEMKPVIQANTYTASGIKNLEQTVAKRSKEGLNGGREETFLFLIYNKTWYTVENIRPTISNPTW